MVLDKFRGQPLVWDKANKLFHEKIVANGSDANGRKLVVQVVNDGVVENLTGASLSLSWKKGNNDGLDGFKVLDASKGLFELYYPTGLLSNVGRMDQANLYLVDSTGATTSRSFEFVVEQGINKEAAESSDSFTALDQALISVGNIDNKADKSDLQALNLAYKESFATLADLKLAYPTGDKFNHVVLSDMMIYMFTTEWVSTGIQANGTGIANNSLTTEKYADKSVVATKTDFLQLKGEKETRVNLMPATLGPLGDYYDHTNGRVSNSPGTQTFKPTGKVSFLGKTTFLSFGVSTWAFFNAANEFVGGKELLPADIPKETTITIPSTASYGIGNVKDWFFPIGDPNRSPYPQGVATATILNKSYEYGMKELIVDSENLSDSVKELIDSKSSGVLQGLIYVNFGDSIIESKDPSVSELFAQQSGAITINVGFGGCMMCPHPNADFAKFSMSNLVDAIASGDFSQQEAALSKPGIPTSFRATLERLKAIDWATVAGITISYGTNDWVNSNKIDNPANPYDKAYYLGALRYSVRKMMQAFKHLQVVVSPPIFRSTNDRTENANNWKNANNEYLKDYANAVARAGNELKILVADTFYGLGINEFNEGQYFPANDGTHPNAKGKALLAGKLVEAAGYGASATPDSGAVEKRVTDLDTKATGILLDQESRIATLEKNGTVNVTNLFMNGDFEIDSDNDGIADGNERLGWYPMTGSLDSTFKKIGSTSQKLVGRAGNDTRTAWPLSVPTVMGHKYYFSGYFKLSTPNVAGQFTLFRGLTAVLSETYLNFTTVSSTDWQHYTYVHTAISNERLLMGIQGIGTTDHWVDGFLAINLTATFGAGNEPTEPQMKRLLEQFPNSWFDGTQNIFLARWALNELRRLDSEKANTKQEEWIAPTLLNGWTEVSATTTPVRYFKDSLGFVHVKGKIQGGNGSAFVLPVGYRPGNLLNFLTWGANRIEVYQSGAISPITPTSQVSIDGITFKAER